MARSFARRQRPTASRPLRVAERRRFTLLATGPAAVLLLLLSVPPTAGALALAFRDRSLERPRSHWVGFANFARMGADHRFWNAVRVTCAWELVTVIGTMIVASVLGVLMFERLRGRTLDAVSLAFLLPILLPRISAGLIWRFLYSPLLGLVNVPARLLHLRPLAFLTDPSTALPAVAIVDVWQWGLFFAVVVARSLGTLPRAPLEAAFLDRASTWQIHLFISLPALRRTVVALVFVKAVESLRSFDLIYTMTAGGPGIATETLDLYAYQTGIGISGRLSYAAAVSVVLTLATTATLSLVWRGAQRWG